MFSCARTADGTTVTTAYTYNAANQLVSAQSSDETFAWQYAFDGNGSLVEVTPGGQAGQGARRYSYHSAGYLVGVETHDGTAYQPQAAMGYDGLGNQISQTIYSAGSAITTGYVVDDQGYGSPLAATAGGQTIFYLHGLSPLGEFSSAWAYPLNDGTDSPRLLTDGAGEVTLSTRYTPWGEVLDVEGQGAFTWGYFGGLMDAATGLIYVGQGQYYDPATGRFLTTQVQPGVDNRYVPHNFVEPAGSLIGPVGLLLLLKARRKKARGASVFIGLIAVFALCVAIAGCTSQHPQPSQTPVPPIPPTAVNYTPTAPEPQSSQTPTPTPTLTPNPIPADCAIRNITGEDWTGVVNVLWNEGASSFSSRRQQDEVFNDLLWTLYSEKKFDPSLQGWSYTEIVKSERYSAHTHFNDSQTWPDEYLQTAEDILTGCVLPPQEFDREAMYFLSATHFLRRAPQELTGGRPPQWVRSSEIPGCGDQDCAFPDIRWRDRLKNSSVSRAEVFIKLLPNTYTLYHPEHKQFQNQFEECYWIGIYFHNWITHETLFNEGNGKSFDAPSFSPNDPEANQLKCPKE